MPQPDGGLGARLRSARSAGWNIRITDDVPHLDERRNLREVVALEAHLERTPLAAVAVVASPARASLRLAEGLGCRRQCTPVTRMTLRSSGIWPVRGPASGAGTKGSVPVGCRPIVSSQMRSVIWPTSSKRSKV